MKMSSDRAMMAVLEGEMREACVPARMVRPRGGRQVGDYCSRVQGKRQAREELTRREGPPPFPSAICRHLCKNDSTAPNGFVCTLHTTWGTYSENNMDQGEAMWARQPDNQCRVQVTCPHCGKTGQKLVVLRWHFDNCPHKLPQLPSPTQSAAHVGMASASPSHVVTQHTV